MFVAPDADILVVDDNPMNLNVIKGLLRATRVFVNTALSGEDALDKIRDTHFDIIFLDHMMPGMDGIETLSELRKINSHVPVYALTANSTADEGYYESKGFNGCLQKPVDTRLLEETIKKHLPKEKMLEPKPKDSVDTLTEMPEEMKWIYDVKGIDVESGIKNSGGIQEFIFSLDMFYDAIGENSIIIRNAYDEENIRLFTIKVHSLKSSARIIGATKLSEVAQILEDAGNNKDMDILNANVDKFISDYEEYKNKLEPIKDYTDTDEGKEMISDEELQGAYEALKDVISQMDYDSVEMIVGELDKYKLPDEDKDRIKRIKKSMKAMDWDTMTAIISED